MGIEIERKFLVKGDFKRQATSSTAIIQGYLSSHPERAVRVRIKGDKGFLTIKGTSNNSGTSRYEWEKEIALEEATDLMKLCEEGVISKMRYLVPFGKHIFEVDEFDGDNKGLILAEIELEDENEIFEKPNWLGEEVTGDVKYYNANLKSNSFKNWK